MGKGLFGRLQGELDAREKSPGLSMGDILELQEPLSGLVNWMMRQQQVDLPGVMAFLHQDEDSARSFIKQLMDKGFVREIEKDGATFYRVRLAPKKGGKLSDGLWNTIDKKVQD
ncbi:MAG: hypothetical protein WCF84_03875 [Anaerolineae bacterium]